MINENTLKAIKLLFVSITVFIIVVFSGAYLTLKCEQNNPNANIKTYSDSLWYALNISSVGDASFSPITNKGRVVGACLIVFGYVCFTINVGLISAVFTHILKREKIIQ